MSSISGSKLRSEEAPTEVAQFTQKQGQYLAYIHLYRRLHRQGPAEGDIARDFRVSPPTVHQMIVKLEELGLYGYGGRQESARKVRAGSR